jgi:hypothetical protein
MKDPPLFLFAATLTRVPAWIRKIFGRPTLRPCRHRRDRGTGAPIAWATPPRTLRSADNAPCVDLFLGDGLAQTARSSTAAF